MYVRPFVGNLSQEIDDVCHVQLFTFIIAIRDGMKEIARYRVAAARRDLGGPGRPYVLSRVVKARQRH